MELNSKPWILVWSLIVLLSCKSDEQVYERKKIKEFNEIKTDLKNVVDYVSKTYYTLENERRFNRLQFTLDNITYLRGNIFSDEKVTKFLKNSSVVSVSFEKASLCLEKHKYDMIRFQLSGRNISNTYYFVYTFCPRNTDSLINNSNFKSIPLDKKNWFLEIEN